MLDSLDYLIIYLSEEKTQTSIIKSFSEFQNEDLTKVLLFFFFFNVSDYCSDTQPIVLSTGNSGLIFIFVLLKVWTSD